MLFHLHSKVTFCINKISIMEKDLTPRSSSATLGGQSLSGNFNDTVPLVGLADLGTQDHVLKPKDEQKEPECITGIPLLTVVICLSMVCFLMLLDSSIIATAIPRITDEFHSLRDVGWYGSAYQLTCASMQPLTGRIYSKFNTKRTLLAFFFLFEVGSLLCGLAVSSKMLIGGRAVAGMGASGLMVGSLTIISSSMPSPKRPLLLGVVMGIGQLGVALGPLLGGLLTEFSSWRWCFYINLPVGAVVSVFMTLIRIPDRVKSSKLALCTLHHDLDLLGFTMFACSAIQLLLALQFGGVDFPWDSSIIIALFCGSSVTFLAWFAWNWHRGDSALIPVSTAGKTIVWSSSLTQLCMGATMFITSYFLPIYFQAVKGVTPLMSGVNLFPTILPQLVFTILSSWLGKTSLRAIRGVCFNLLIAGTVSKTGYTIPYGVFAAVATTAGVALLSLLQPSSEAALWVGLQILPGACRGIGMQMVGGSLS